MAEVLKGWTRTIHEQESGMFVVTFTHRDSGHKCIGHGFDIAEATEKAERTMAGTIARSYLFKEREADALRE
jgi:hypothetical protein